MALLFLLLLLKATMGPCRVLPTQAFFLRPAVDRRSSETKLPGRHRGRRNAGAGFEARQQMAS